MRLKKLYSSREVTAQTGLSARQLQWWHDHGLLVSAIPSHSTTAGGRTARRYTPVDVIELMVLAELRRREFSIADIRRLLKVLRLHFGVRLFDAIEGGGPLTLFVDGQQLFARTHSGALYNLLENPGQPLLMLEAEPRLRRLLAREQRSGGRKVMSGGRPKSN